MKKLFSLFFIFILLFPIIGYTTDRKPIISVGGQLKEIPVGDSLLVPSATISNLTSGYLPKAGTGGLLGDSSISQGSSGEITVTNGIIINVTSHGTSEAATTATMYGNTHRVTGAYVVTLPAAVVGMSANFRATTAAVMTLDSNASGAFVLNGVALTNGNKIVSSGVAGESVYVECTIANKWDVYPAGAFSDGGA